MPSLPDTGQPVSGENLTLYPPADGIGPYTAVPDRLELAVRPDGTPDLRLELVRSFGVEQLRYGVLDLRVYAAADLDSAARVLAATGRAGPVESAAWQQGAVRFAVPGLAVSAPQTLIGDGLGGVRCTQVIDADAAVAVDALLSSDAGALAVVAEVELLAAPPRMPATVTFVPADLLAALGPGRHGWAELPGDAGLFTVDGDIADAELFALALAARIRAAYGEFATDPDSPGRSSLTLRPPTDDDRTPLTWDLRRTVIAPHPVVLRLDLAAAFVGHDVDALRRFVDVPPLRTGFRQVVVTGNLPPDRTGAVLGVRLRKAATADRPVPVDEFVRLAPPEDRATAVIQLSPAEAPDLDISTVAHLQHDDAGTVEGRAWTSDDRSVLVGPADFAVRFLAFGATPAVLDQADVDGTVTWRAADGPREWTFRLDGAHPGRTLVLPRDAEVLATTVVASRGGRTVTVALPVPMPDRLARHHFPHFGANAVVVRCRFAAGAARLFAEFRPEGAAEIEATRLGFTPERPEATYRWFSDSIFATGYRYRLIAPSGEPGPWSGVQPPDRALDLTAEGQPMTIEVSGVRFFRDRDDPARAYFDLGPPDAVRTAGGRVQVWIREAPGRLMLQLTACLQPTTARIEELRPAVAARLGLADPALLKLAPRPGRVGPARLLMDADVLASGRPASTPPFTAMLPATVEGTAADRVRAAVRGERGNLAVGYAVAFEDPVRVTVVCAGDVAAALPHLGPDAAAGVQKLLADGVLTLTCSADPEPAPPEVCEHLTGRAVATAAQMLGALLAADGRGETRLHVELSETAHITTTVDLRADVADWMTA
ncbi:hypothetical protein [Virgisporangium aurantiacum]|uniref:Uncharacterized protein n=1 Tax=Virgisporangium aurantiacum TaxID=175570 RepID=A0A8J3Z5K8_9ACTN|nr:hypothetical protein [Virgisporangium aurantiacum]GIJ57317.1 hypothetical protein Vau01_048330 [Virgisporangium aurantiacum]